MRALAHVVATADASGRTRLTRLQSEAPLSLRPAGDAVYLVGSAAGPLGGDDLGLVIDVEAGAQLIIRTVAPSLALPGTQGAASRFIINVTVGEGASLRWLPEPLIAAARCNHELHATVSLAKTATLEWRDEMVLGRWAERPGTCHTRLDVDVCGRPLLRHGLRVGARGWDGQAVIGGAKAVGQVLLAGQEAAVCERPSSAARATGSPEASVLETSQGQSLGPRAGVMALDGNAILVTALADDAVALRAQLERGTRAARAEPILC